MTANVTTANYRNKRDAIVRLSKNIFGRGCLLLTDRIRSNQFPGSKFAAFADAFAADLTNCVRDAVADALTLALSNALTGRAEFSSMGLHYAFQWPTIGQRPGDIANV